MHGWRIKQALLAISQVLIDSQVLPAPSMDVFDKLQPRIIAYLKMQGVNASEIRGIQMVRRLAGIYSILNALLCIYDVPGAIHAGKEFEMSQLLDMIPYMYCTKQIAIFTMTQTEEVFLHPMRGVVLRACLAMAKFPYVPNKTIEQYFRDDKHRRLENAWRRDENGKDKSTINFNYVRLEGEYRDLCACIAEFCEPKIGATEVDGMLTVLTGAFIGVRHVQTLGGDFYDTLTEGPISQFTLTRQDKERPLQVVQKDYANKRIYIAVEALGKLHDDQFFDAIGACLYSGWRPQAMLTGVQVRKEHPLDAERSMNYAGIFNVLEISPEVVEGMAVMPTFAAPNAEYIPKSSRPFFEGPRLHPDKQKERYNSKRTKRSASVIHIEEDLDDWGCKQHHYRSAMMGDAADSPAMPLTLFHRIREAVLKVEMKHRWNNAEGTLEADKYKDLPDPCRRMNYPLDLVEDADRFLKDGKKARPFLEVSQVLADVHNREVEQWEKQPNRQQLPRPAAADFNSMVNGVRKRWGKTGPASMTLHVTRQVVPWTEAVADRGIPYYTTQQNADIINVDIEEYRMATLRNAFDITRAKQGRIQGKRTGPTPRHQARFDHLQDISSIGPPPLEERQSNLPSLLDEGADMAQDGCETRPEDTLAAPLYTVDPQNPEQLMLHGPIRSKRPKRVSRPEEAARALLEKSNNSLGPEGNGGDDDPMELEDMRDPDLDSYLRE
jgi:hypothetical protein